MLHNIVIRDRSVENAIEYSIHQIKHTQRENIANSSKFNWTREETIGNTTFKVRRNFHLYTSHSFWTNQTQ